jgi:Heterokaryon incompatibility protein (HET)
MQSESSHPLEDSNLWIDSLCIIQDCLNDWARELVVMGSIYENAVCTISAHAASNSHYGCYETRDPLRYSLCRVLSTANHTLYAAIPLGDVTESVWAPIGSITNRLIIALIS